jgi:hypothetical protein
MGGMRVRASQAGTARPRHNLQAEEYLNIWWGNATANLAHVSSLLEIEIEMETRDSGLKWLLVIRDQIKCGFHARLHPLSDCIVVEVVTTSLCRDISSRM